MLSLGRGVPEVAKALGIGENRLYKWRADEKARLPLDESADRAEIEQLRKQVKNYELPPSG